MMSLKHSKEKDNCWKVPWSLRKTGSLREVIPEKTKMLCQVKMAVWLWRMKKISKMRMKRAQKKKVQVSR